jgi:hypothetical protein
MAKILFSRIGRSCLAGRHRLSFAYMSANAKTLKRLRRARQSRAGHEKVTQAIGKKTKKRHKKDPPGPHKTWAKFVRKTLDELPWTREETPGFLNMKEGWLKKAINGYFVRGDYRDAFQDRLTIKWDEYRKDKPELEALVWPPFVEKDTNDETTTARDRDDLLLKDAPNLSQPKPTIPIIAPSRISFRGRDTKCWRLIGRDDERKALDFAWDGDAAAWQSIFNRHMNKKLKLTGQPHTPRIVVFNAWAGIGKTSLVVKWAADKLAKDNHSGIERYFDWSFYNQGTHCEGEATAATKVASADLFLKEALELFGDSALAASNATAWQKGERLAQLIGQHRTLLILDGLEPLQDVMTGELCDEGMRALLRGLSAHNPGLCLVTTRQHLPDLSDWRQTTALEWELARLTDEYGAALLTMLGVYGTDSEKRDLSARVKGHALTLTLLGRYLKRAHHGDIRRVDRVDFQKVNKKEQGGHTFRVIAAYERWFEEKGCRAELAILRMLGLFDRPATPDCLAALQKPPIPGLTNDVASLTEDDWNEAVTHLVELNLVEEQPWEPRCIVGYSEEQAKASMRDGQLGKCKPFENPQPQITNQNSLDAHPLIRAFFARRLKESAANTWKTAHSRLFDHLRNSVPYWPEGLNGLQPLYQAITHGCQAGRYEEARADIFRDRTYRCISGPQRFYSTRKIGAFGSGLAALACFFEEPWIRPASVLPKTEQAWVLGETAFQLRSVGRLSESLEPMQASLSMLVKEEKWEWAAIVAGNLSELNLMLGNVARGQRDAEQGVTFADRSGNSVEREDERVVFADALHQAGNDAEARKHFEKAEVMRSERKAEYPLLYSVWGFRYCDFLLASAECAAWRVFLQDEETTSSRLQSRQKRVRNQNGKSNSSDADQIGGKRYHLQIQSCRKVEQRANQTLKWAEKFVGSSLLGIAIEHLTIGRLLIYLALLEHSVSLTRHLPHESIDNAVNGLRKAGDMSFFPRSLLARAWLWVLEGKLDMARADLDEAKQIAERGPMRLNLADIHLHRARLFRDKEELKLSRDLIEQRGYWRRKKELEDAEEAARHW